MSTGLPNGKYRQLLRELLLLPPTLLQGCLVPFSGAKSPVLMTSDVFLTLLFLCAGLAIDAGMVQVRRLALQHAADAAALGALYEKSRGYTDWVAAGKADAALNGFADGVNGVTITIQNPPTSGSYSGDDSAIQVQISQTYATTFMGVLGANGNATPGTGAVAKILTNPDCVYIMGSPSSSYSLNNKSYSGFYPSCNVYVNSTVYSIDDDSGSTIRLGSSATIKVRARLERHRLRDPQRQHRRMALPLRPILWLMSQHLAFRAAPPLLSGLGPYPA